MSQQQDDGQERDLPASERKIQNARKEGNVPRSKELSAGLTLLTAVCMMFFVGPGMISDIKEMTSKAFTFSKREAFDPQMMNLNFISYLFDALYTLVPLFLAVMIAGVVGSTFVGGLNWSTKALEPKLSKLNPIKGLKNIFSSNGAVEFVKAVLKSLLIGGVGYWLVLDGMREFVHLSSVDLETGLSMGAELIIIDLLIVSLLFLAIIAIDVPFQMWKYFKGLRMNIEEMKKEHKESEGDPYLKAKVKSLQREAAKKRMMASVGTASVVVTNPTHYSVALKYDPLGQEAPQVVAKGKGLLALKIRELAKENEVPMIEAPPLARALYANVDLEARVPEVLYQAVAKLLAYIYSLEKNNNKDGLKPPTAKDIPEGLDPGVSNDSDSEED